MAVFNLFSSFLVHSLAIINDTAKTLAVVNDHKGTATNLNYIIGGLIVIVLILVGSTLFSKK